MPSSRTRTMRPRFAVILPGDPRALARPRRPRRPSPARLVIHFLLLLCAMAFLAPLLLVVSASFSSEHALAQYGYGLLPREFTTRAYQFVLGDPTQLIQAYGISIFVTVVGTFASMLVMALLAYALSRDTMPARRVFSFAVVFTMLFSGGLVPSYILMTQYLHLQNTLLALILPYIVVPWSILLLRTYFRGLPGELIEAAKIDGASELRIFFSIVLPLSGPALATIGMFTMLTYWNDWWLGLLYLNDSALSPVQLWLYRIISNVDAVSSNPNLVHTGDVPAQSLRMAVAVLVIVPIVGAFLFLQKYFVRGITVGGVRG